MIDFARGHPNSSLLPSEETRRVLEELCCQSSGAPTNDALRVALQYGRDDGNDDFLVQLEDFIKRHTMDDDFGELQRTIEEPADAPKGTRLFATGGVSHGIELLCATQTKPGDVVLVERPTYFLVGGIFKSHGLIVRGLPMHRLSGAVDVDKLVELVEDGIMEVPRMIYIIPTHQNPTGHTMSIDDRIKLTSFAHRRGVLVISDEVYHLLDWRQLDSDGARPARMASLSTLMIKRKEIVLKEGGGCVSVSSFTKIFAPGVRLGWIEGAPQIVESIIKYGYIRSQGGCAPLVGEIMRVAIATGAADNVLNKLRAEYKIRSDKMRSALSAESRIEIVNRPLGGYFMWIKFPNSVNSEKFLDYCKERVKFMLGVRCEIAVDDGMGTAMNSDEGLFTSHARLCFADLDMDMLEAGITELVTCFQEYVRTLV